MKKYILNKGFISQNNGGKTIIFDPNESKLHTLNPAASFIFNKLKKGATEKQIIDSLVKEYGIEKKDAEKDLNYFLKDLVLKKFISDL